MDMLGAVLWAGVFVGLGQYFHAEVGSIVRVAAEFGLIAGLCLTIATVSLRVKSKVHRSGRDGVIRAHWN